MKKVWVLERFVSVDEMKETLTELFEMRRKNEGNDKELNTCDEMIEAYKRRIEENPDGYWLGYQGKINYRDFCFCAKQTIKNFARDDFKKKFGNSEFRVVKAEIEDNAQYWLGYKNPVENEGVLKYLYATI